MNADSTRQVTLTKRIAIVGPECTGKTSLAQALALHYQTKWVPEFARDFLNTLNRPYTEADLLTIAKGQVALEDKLYKDANTVLVCDTNLLVIKVWSEFKYKRCDPWILNELISRKYDLYLLTNIDVVWQEDPQREHPHQREELFAIYKQNLLDLHLPFVEISGVDAAREVLAKNAITKLLINE